MKKNNEINEDACVRNMYGISVRKICASCAYIGYGIAANERICLLGRGMVEPCETCEAWIMHDRYENAGLANGYVKKKEYFDYLVAEHNAFIQSRGEKGYKKEEEDKFMALCKREFIQKHKTIYTTI